MDGPGLMDVVIAPLRWVERARGWRRAGLLGLYLAVAGGGGVLAWREWSLRGIPRLAEPFDVARLGTVEVRDVDNAMVGYAEAARLLRPVDRAAIRDKAAWGVTDWSRADPAFRRWVEGNGPAIEAYLRAADRPESCLIQPKDWGPDSPVGLYDSFRKFADLALLEGSRREQAGDLGGAWRLYRAALRSSRHVGRHVGAFGRLLGQSLLSRARPRAIAWAESPALTPALVRRALDDLAGCVALTSPTSEMVRVEFFHANAVLDRPDLWRKLGAEEDPEDASTWYGQYPSYHRARRFFRHEPERSRRLLRLVVAGQLAQCDRPAAERPPVLFPEFSIHAHDARTPPAVRAIEPAELEARARQALLPGVFPSLQHALAQVDLEADQFDRIRLAMVERAYRLSHGRAATTYGDLLGPDLKALPRGYAPDDPTEPGEAVGEPPPRP